MRRPWLATEGIIAAWSVPVCDTFSGGTEPRRSFLGPRPVIYLSISAVDAKSMQHCSSENVILHIFSNAKSKVIETSLYYYLIGMPDKYVF